MTASDASAAAISKCRAFAAQGAALVAALSLTVLLGWAFDIDALKDFGATTVTMKPNSALGFLLASASLFLASRSSASAGWGTIQRLLGDALLLLGLLTLAEYALGMDFGIDQLLFAAPHEPASHAPPGRMAMASAFGLALTGLALGGVDGHRKYSLAQCAACFASLLGLLVVLAHLYDAAGLYGLGATSTMPPTSGLCLVLINFGVLLCRPQRGLGVLLTSTTVGGVLARRLLPLALVAPALIGWLRLLAEERGLFEHELGPAFVAIAHTALFTLIVWRTALQLRRGEQRRLAAEQAQESKSAQLDSLVRSAMDGIIMVDEAQHIVLFNPAAEQIFGYPAAAVLDGPLEKLLPERFHAAHAGHMRAFEAASLLTPLTPGVRTLHGRRANGQEFPLDVSLAHVRVQGALHYVAIVRDVTQRQHTEQALHESELRFRTLAAATFEGIVISENGRIMDVNPQFAALLGVPREELLGRAVAECIAPEAVERVLAHIRSGLDSHIEHDMLCRDGSRRTVEAHGQTLQQDGRSIRLTAIRDISARKEAENALHAAMAEAQRANDAKSRFLAAASHDLRQPLAALSIYTSSLKGRMAPADQPLLANMNACIGSLSELLTDLLDLSKLEAGAVTPHPKNFQLAEMLANLASVHAPEAQLKGLSLRCLPSAWTVFADQVLLGRILGNLIANAIRYTPRGGVLVGCRRRDGKRWIEVWDTGIGIPAAQTEEIFEEFRQLGDGARNRGSGLGLAIVARTARLLGLAIRVRSRPGRGSLFAIEVPPGRREQAFAGMSGEAPRYRPLRIALVEDNTQFRLALGYSLEALGHRLLSLASSDELQARLNSFEPDILISDYRLAQGETGFDVIQRARVALGEALPALLLTGDTDSRLVRSMAERGVIVVHKPVDLETLQVYLETMAVERQS